MSDPRYEAAGDRADHLIEECAELTQAVMKARRFGWETRWLGEPNALAVLREIGDVIKRCGEVSNLVAEAYLSEPRTGIPVKIYLAARNSRSEELRRYRDELVAAGFQVTSRWIDSPHLLSGRAVILGHAERERIAQEDLQDLAAADCVISFTEPPTSVGSKGGRHVEHGVALMLKKRMVVVGWRENVFHCMPGTEFYLTWEEARDQIYGKKES